MAELPGVTYDAEFQTLAAARQFFDILCGREQRAEALAAKITELRQQGKTQADVARLLDVSIRTVGRYEERRTGQNPL